MCGGGYQNKMECEPEAAAKDGWSDRQIVEHSKQRHMEGDVAQKDKWFGWCTKAV